MSSNDLYALSAADIAHGVLHRNFSAVDVLNAVIARVQTLNPQLNAIIGFDAEAALFQAREVDRQVQAGANREQLPLAGVPITVKDNLWVAGRRITQGSKLFEDFIAPEDAWVVARAKALGAVILGITNCSEFACKGITENLLHGMTRSPWDPALTPGGSSGGAASAVAAGFGPLALVTDAGGSTRRPAAHCGLVGMKPSFGLVPYGPGFEEPNFSISVIGQLARNVGDAALLLDALVAWHPLDPASQPIALAPVSPRLDAIEPGLRIAFSRTLGCDFAIDADVLARFEDSVAQLRHAGFDIVDADPAWPDGAREYPLLALQHAGLDALYGAALDQDASRIDPDLQAQIRAGRRHSGTDLAHLLLLRERIAGALSSFFTRFDVLLCPTAPVTSWPIGQLGPATIGGRPVGPRGHAAFTPLFNYCGVPACSVPVGLVRGLPVGMQVVAARYRDDLVLQFARQIELACGWSSRIVG